MRWLNGYRMRLILGVFVVSIVLGGTSAKADFVFGEPVNLGPTVNSSSGDATDCFSDDDMEMYFDSYNRPGGHGGWDIWISRRSTIDDDWGAPSNLGPPVNTGQTDSCAYISTDGLDLYFSSNRSGGYGDLDIWVIKRATKDDAWGVPENLGSLVNSLSLEFGPNISTDGLELYFNSRRSGGHGSDDIWVSKRATKNDPWGPPENLGPVVNSSASESVPCLSTDGLALFFSEERNQPIRPGGFGNADLWMTRRASISDKWGTPVNLGPVLNTSSYDGGPRISPDGSMLYFCSERPGGLGGPYGDIYQAPIIPIVDLNSDLKVDLEDMHIMVDHWGKNYPLCDIGPTPLGDGVVDIHDFIVLAEHLYRLTAHWKLDENDGIIAYDSYGDYDGSINGNPFWHPTGGMKGGALLLDGIDDYVSTPFIVDPAKGSFSVFAWVYSWMPGQVIISQTGEFGGTWLGTNPSGKLMTGFGDMYFGALVSDTVITDVQWHHVVFVYDMDSLHRRLYVDGVLVAEDTTFVAGMPSDGGLYIGASKDLDAGTLFSGFIDDVRIYNQALTAEEIAALAQ